MDSQKQDKKKSQKGQLQQINRLATRLPWIAVSIVVVAVSFFILQALLSG